MAGGSPDGYSISTGSKSNPLIASALGADGNLWRGRGHGPGTDVSGQMGAGRAGHRGAYARSL